MLEKVDHIVLGVKKLQEGIEYIQDMTGATCALGGKHPQFGTHNALLKIGKVSYLEILAPDPEQEFSDPIWMGLDLITNPRVTRIALKSNQLSKEAAYLSHHFPGHGNIQEGRRQKPDDSWLEWQLSLPLALPKIDGIPFLIDWGKSKHPAKDLKQQCELIEVQLSTTNFDPLKNCYRQLSSNVLILAASENKISLTLETPKGILTLE